MQTKTAGKLDRKYTQETLFPVQEFLFPRKEFPTDLYVKHFGTCLLEKKTTNGEIEKKYALKKGDWLSTNTYFNSFYLAYWAEYTDITDLFFKIRYTGTISIAVFSDAEEETRKLIATNICSSPEKIKTAKSVLEIIAIVDFIDSTKTVLPSNTGRIFVEITAIENASVIDMAFCTSSPPQRSISLSIGICTFNREDYLTKTLSEVNREMASSSSIKKVFVVNQSKKFSSTTILTIFNQPNFKLIEQKNLGGCGGFTRSIIESQNDPQSFTNHLLMDDDIFLDGRIITQSIRFLTYANREIVLGGSMLDSIYPTTMYEAGAFLNPRQGIDPYAHKVDMSDSRGLGWFNKRVETDYNAWWFCVLPLEQTKQLNLPAPIFIRGDDIEYGIRLAKAEIHTVSLPGIALWHEPFYIKPPGWQQYYDLRNRLILNATYQDSISFTPTKDIIYVFLNSLLKHNYGETALLHKAMKDYLSGPDALFDTGADLKHVEVNTCNAKYPVKTLNSNEVRGLELQDEKPRTVRTWPAVYLLIRRCMAMLLLPYNRHNPKLVDADHAHVNSIRNDAYIMTNEPQTYYLEFTPSRRKFLAGLVRTLILTAQYALGNQKCAATWNKKIFEFQTKNYWEKVFNR